MNELTLFWFANSIAVSNAYGRIHMNIQISSSSKGLLLVTFAIG